MHATKTIKVPEPICLGTSDYSAFVVFEKLSLGGYGSPEVFGERLAALHMCTSPNGKYGFHVNNTIGATFQPNTWHDTWADFWDKERLGHILSLCKRDGASCPWEEELRAKVKAILNLHDCKPSLIHGDLWSGNQGFLTDGTPAIFDPAAYWGDYEADLAMTKLFGSNAKGFYAKHAEAMGPDHPKDGWELRQTIYNFYHIANHYVLFGGGYWQQAENMAMKILKA